MRHRVVVTGCGVVCSLGNTVAEFTEALRTGRSGIRIYSTDAAGPPVAAGCPEFDDTCAEQSGTERALFDPISRYAMSAAKEALDQSGLLTERELCRRTAVFLGTAMGGAHATEEAHRDVWYHGSQPKPLTVLCAMNNAAASHLSIRFGLKGPNLTYSVPCASSALAIGDAFVAIRDGRVERALVGGAEACVTPVVVRSWQSMRILAPVDVRTPEATCKPFARDRSGIVLGSGAAILVLETLEEARARGAPVLCELLGFGCSADGTHICIPSSEGQTAAMLAALEDAGVAAKAIDYINAHGTGTRVGDLSETEAIRRAFGHHADVMPVSATKAAHGHLLGAAGALELVASIMAMRGGFLPATLNLRELDPACDLDYVPQVPRSDISVHTFMTNSFAFGGSNAVLIAGELR